MRIYIFQLFLVLAIGSTAVFAEVTNVDPQTVEKMAEQGALIIDVRTPDEWESTGLIPGSRPLMFFDDQGSSDPGQWLNALRKLKTSQDQPVVLVCHSGNRSSRVARFLDSKTGMSNVYNLENGIKGWQKSGKQTRKCPAGDC